MAFYKFCCRYIVSVAGTTPCCSNRNMIVLVHGLDEHDRTARKASVQVCVGKMARPKRGPAH